MESEVHRGRVNISKANGPSDSSVIPTSSGPVVHGLEKQTAQTRSESESDTGTPDSVIQTESEVHRYRVNISKANRPTDSSVIPASSGSVVHGLEKRTAQTRSESESDTGTPDSVIQTESEVHRGRVNISKANRLTDSSVIPALSGSVVHGLEKRTAQTRSESESDTGTSDSVIQTESEVHRGRVNISKANRPTDSSVIPASSGSVVHGLGKRSAQTKSESESVASIPNPVIQTGNEVQIDCVNISIANSQTESTVTPPSSDSGVHSLGEQWENMSTNSMDTD